MITKYYSGLTRSQIHAEVSRELSDARVRVLERRNVPGADVLAESVKAKLRRVLQEYVDPCQVHRVWS